MMMIEVRTHQHVVEALSIVWKWTLRRLAPRGVSLRLGRESDVMWLIMLGWACWGMIMADITLWSLCISLVNHYSLGVVVPWIMSLWHHIALLWLNTPSRMIVPGRLLLLLVHMQPWLRVMMHLKILLLLLRMRMRMRNHLPMHLNWRALVDWALNLRGHCCSLDL